MLSHEPVLIGIILSSFPTVLRSLVQSGLWLKSQVQPSS